MAVDWAALKKAGGLKGSWRESEAWYHVAGLQSLKRGKKSMGDDAASVAGAIPACWRCQDCAVDHGQEQVWRGAFLAQETSCVCFL